MTNLGEFLESDALVLSSGDRLVIRVSPMTTPEAFDQLRAALEDRLPDVETLILGVEQIAVLKSERADG